MRCLPALCGLILIALAATSWTDEKPAKAPSLKEDMKLLGTAFNWVQDPPAPKPGGIVLNFAGGSIFLEHAVDVGNGKLDTRRLGRVAFELKEVGDKRVIRLKEKNDQLADITYSLKNDRLIIEEGECNLHGKTSLKGKWQRWLGDYAVSGSPHWPCPWAVVSDQLTSRPLAMFCGLRESGNKAKLAYLLLFEVPEGFSTDGYVPSTSYASTDERRSHSHSFAIAGRTFEMSYEVKLDPKTSTPGPDSLTLGKTAIKEGETRCYVVDMTGPKTIYRPIKTDLPKVTLDLPKEASEEPKDWYRPAPQWATPVMQAVGEIKKAAKAK